MPAATFKDHFSAQAKIYAQFRPTYPEELFSYLAGLCENHARALDVATGNGQAAIGLAPHFGEIIATDASAAQIQNAKSHPKVFYRVLPAERTDFPDGHFDLIAVAQALHWFNHDAFFCEVRRTLKPGGIFAAWLYELFDCPGRPALAKILDHYYRDVVGPYWPPERRHIESGYREIALPYPDIQTPDFTLTTRWSRDEILGYLRSWSATQAFAKGKGYDPTDEILSELVGALPDAGEKTELKWPLTLRACRKPL